MVKRPRTIERVALVRRGRPHLYGGIFILLAVLWVAGFANFTIRNANAPSPMPETAENMGIVVLTGGADRIQWGMDALTQGRGERLLISGVNEATRRGEVRELLDDPGEVFECCVDLDYTARNTIANANAAVAWAEEYGFERLWVVTSYYHMPRTLLEFHYRAPELAVYPIRVQPTGYRADNWWRPNTLRILAWEYTKYEIALMRVRIAIFFGA